MATSDTAPYGPPSPAKSDQPSLQPIRRHDKFYISDGKSTSIFLIEDTLYKVHRYFLVRESSVFQMMFDCPHPTEGQDGESDDKPIHLPGVSCSEFEALIDFFYNGMFTHERKKSECNVPKSNPRAFYDLLSISLRFELDRVTREVVAHIDDCADDTDPVTKICLGLAHDSLQHWIRPAYDALIKRDCFLTQNEIIRLGAGRTAIVGANREKYIRGEFRTPSAFSSFHGEPWPTLALEVPLDFYSA
ncbi:hypothetical protein BYT27DRAFT_7206287 [Phlegmacium glaucopus]|nr:hypothetical protein BYT27DRAFT_7206287 [Phlegmacium glaucopus]